MLVEQRIPSTSKITLLKGPISAYGPAVLPKACAFQETRVEAEAASRELQKLQAEVEAANAELTATATTAANARQEVAAARATHAVLLEEAAAIESQLQFARRQQREVRRRNEVKQLG